MAQNKLSDLRDHIFMALERLSDETLTTDQVNVEVDKAKAISQLAGTLIQSAKVEIDFINATGVMESQSDLFFFGSEEEEFKIGLIVIDAFTKEITVFLLKNKTPDVILPALEQAFKNLGGTPEIFYTDDEGAYNSSILKLYFQKNNIKHIITRKHAPMAERAIKTIKDMLYKRMKHETTRPWYELVHEILFVINYMRKHSAHGMTPKEARKPENYMKVKNNLENNRVKNRKYQDIKVGDKVRIYKKKKNFQKSNVSIWSENRYEVKQIEDVPNAGKLYHLIGMPKPMLRAEILL
jgi:uncharacterized membrane protein (UPF0127 family)